MTEKNNQSPIYVFFLLGFSLLILFVAFFHPGFMRTDFVIGSVIALFLLAACFLDIKLVVFATALLLPALSGLESHQINITGILQAIGIQKDYQIDFFLLARIFILFIAGIEVFRRGRAIFKTPLFFLLALSIVLNIPSFIFSEYKIFGLAYYWFFIVSAFGAYFLGYFLFGSKRDYLKLIITILLSAVIPTIFGLKQIVTGDFFYSNDTTLPRLTTVFEHPNKFASYLFLILGLYLVFHLAVQIKKAKSKIHSPSLIPFIILGLFFLLTFSRTSWIAFAIIVFVIAFLKREVRFPAIYLGSLLIFLSLFIGKVRDRIMGIFVREYGDTLSGRVETWSMAWFEFQKNYWIGYGPGSFKEVIKTVSGTDIGNFYPHSDVVLFLLEGGVIGLFSYLIYLLSALYYAFHSYLAFPTGTEKIIFAKREFLVDFKLLGFMPFLLFLVMIPYSFAEAPALDFIYQFYAWILLGSWLGLVNREKTI